jgi:hypothetical protein
VCHEAEELLLALAEVEAAPRAREVRAVRASFATAPANLATRRYDARVLAERLLAESQHHAVLSAAPTDLLAAQANLDAMSEDLLAQLLASLAAGSYGSDGVPSMGGHERGLLALLALQLYVQESKVRQARRRVDATLLHAARVGGDEDERLLEVLAVPHAASRPVGERRPRGRPRR